MASLPPPTIGIDALAPELNRAGFKHAHLALGAQSFIRFAASNAKVNLVAGKDIRADMHKHLLGVLDSVARAALGLTNAIASSDGVIGSVDCPVTPAMVWASVILLRRICLGNRTGDQASFIQSGIMAALKSPGGGPVAPMRRGMDAIEAQLARGALAMPFTLNEADSVEGEEDTLWGLADIAYRHAGGEAAVDAPDTSIVSMERLGYAKVRYGAYWRHKTVVAMDIALEVMASQCKYSHRFRVGVDFPTEAVGGHNLLALYVEGLRLKWRERVARGEGMPAGVEDEDDGECAEAGKALRICDDMVKQQEFESLATHKNLRANATRALKEYHGRLDAIKYRSGVLTLDTNEFLEQLQAFINDNGVQESDLDLAHKQRARAIRVGEVEARDSTIATLVSRKAMGAFWRANHDSSPDAVHEPAWREWVSKVAELKERARPGGAIMTQLRQVHERLMHGDRRDKRQRRAKYTPRRLLEAVFERPEWADARLIAWARSAGPGDQLETEAWELRDAITDALHTYTRMAYDIKSNLALARYMDQLFGSPAYRGLLDALFKRNKACSAAHADFAQVFAAFPCPIGKPFGDGDFKRLCKLQMSGNRGKDEVRLMEGIEDLVMARADYGLDAMLKALDDALDNASLEFLATQMALNDRKFAVLTWGELIRELQAHMALIRVRIIDPILKDTWWREKQRGVSESFLTHLRRVAARPMPPSREGLKDNASGVIDAITAWHDGSREWIKNTSTAIREECDKLAKLGPKALFALKMECLAKQTPKPPVDTDGDEEEALEVRPNLKWQARYYTAAARFKFTRECVKLLKQSVAIGGDVPKETKDQCDVLVQGMVRQFVVGNRVVPTMTQFSGAVATITVAVTEEIAEVICDYYRRGGSDGGWSSPKRDAAGLVDDTVRRVIKRML